MLLGVTEAESYATRKLNFRLISFAPLHTLGYRKLRCHSHPMLERSFQGALLSSKEKHR
jgi:hypothetical protein